MSKNLSATLRSPLALRLRPKAAAADSNNNAVDQQEPRSRLPSLRGLSLSPRLSSPRSGVGARELRKKSMSSGSNSCPPPAPPGVMEVGLENLGNTCFMNSSLQCLLHIQPLVSYFLANDIDQVLNKRSPMKGLIATSFALLVKEIANATAGSAVAPVDFQRVVGRHAPHLLDNQQQDCQEFLRFLLDGMSDDLCRNRREGSVSTSPSAAAVATTHASPDAGAEESALTVETAAGAGEGPNGSTSPAGGEVKHQPKSPPKRPNASSSSSHARPARSPNQSQDFDAHAPGGDATAASAAASAARRQEASASLGIADIPTASAKVSQRLREQVAHAAGPGHSPGSATEGGDPVAVSSKSSRSFHHPQRIRRLGPASPKLEPPGVAADDQALVIEGSPMQLLTTTSSKSLSNLEKLLTDPTLEVSKPLSLASGAGRIDLADVAIGSSRKSSPRTPRLLTTPPVQAEGRSSEVASAALVSSSPSPATGTPGHTSRSTTPRMRLRFPHINLRSIANLGSSVSRGHTPTSSAQAIAAAAAGTGAGGPESEDQSGKDPIGPPLSPEEQLKSQQQAVEQSRKSWEGYLGMNDSVVTDIFAGQLQSTIECLTCRHRSFCFDPFLDLSVPIPKPPDAVPSKSAWRRTPAPAEPSKCPLEECIAKFTGEEILDGENMYFCEHCKEKRKCTKKLSIFRYPRILVIHIMRFRYSEVSREKLSTDVTFPLRGLDLTPFMSADRIGTRGGAPPAQFSPSALPVPPAVSGSLKASQSLPNHVTSATVDGAAGDASALAVEGEGAVAAPDAVGSNVDDAAAAPTAATANAANAAATADAADATADVAATTPGSPTTPSKATNGAAPQVPADKASEVNPSAEPAPAPAEDPVSLGPAGADECPPVYDLVGVSNHCGTLNGGHYIAHIDTNATATTQGSNRGKSRRKSQRQRNQEVDADALPDPDADADRDDDTEPAAEPRWVCFNDEHVSLTSSSSVVGPSAYVLFFRLREG